MERQNLTRANEIERELQHIEYILNDLNNADTVTQATAMYVKTSLIPQYESLLLELKSL